MNEDVRPRVLLDEAPPLLVVEPLHASHCHRMPPLLAAACAAGGAMLLRPPGGRTLGDSVCRGQGLGAPWDVIASSSSRFAFTLGSSGARERACSNAARASVRLPGSRAKTVPRLIQALTSAASSRMAS